MPRQEKRCWQPTVRREEKQMSKYPLDQNDMQEQYEDPLIKAALKEHARKERCAAGTGSRRGGGRSPCGG